MSEAALAAAREAIQASPQSQQTATTPQEAAPSAPATPQIAARFKRNIFIKKEETGVQVTRRDRKGEGTTPEYVDFSEGMKEQYRRFLEDYTTNLNELRKQPDPANPNQTLLDAVLSNPQHVYDRELLSLLGKEIVDQEGRVVDREVDSQKIDSFLKSPRGWIVTTQLLEYQTTLKLFALGLHAAMLPEGERQALADPNLIRLNWDQGLLSQLVHNQALPWLTEPAFRVAGRTPINLPRFLQNLQRWHVGLGGLMSTALVGPTLTAVEGLGALLLRSMRQGVALDLRQCTAAFQAIQGSAVESAYVRATAGIDVNDYQIVPGVANQIQVAPGRTPETMRNAEFDLKKEVLQGLYTRMEFYTALNVPPENLDALPSQAQYLMDIGQPEQTGARWAMRTADEFTRLLGPPGGIGPPIPRTMQERIQFFMQAQRNVMVADIRDHIRIQQTEAQGDISQKKISTLEAKKQARAEGGTLRAERTKQFSEAKSINEGSRDTAQTERNTVSEYREAVNALQNARQELQTRLAAMTVNGNPVTTLEEALQGLNRVLTQTRVIVNINGRNVDSIFDRAQIARDTRNTAFAGITLGRGVTETDESFRARERAAREPIEEIYRSELALIQEDVDFINRAGGEGIEPGIIKQLQKLNARIQENQNKLLESDPTVVQSRDIFDTLSPDFDAITAIDAALTGAAPPLAAVGLTENDLRTQTIDELIRRINTASVAGAGHVPLITIGWPEAQNSRSEFRRQLMHSMVEARARATEAIDPTRTGARVIQFNTITGWGITENQLRSIAQEDLERRINQEFTASGRGWNVADNVANRAVLENAILEARNRLLVRFNTYDQVINALNGRTQQLDGQISGVNFEQENRRIDVTLDVMRRKDDIYSNALGIASDSARFVNVAVPVAGNADFASYSQAEQTAAQPRGYYEIMDLLFDYRNKTNRNEYFQGAMEILSPQQLAERLNESLNLGIAAPPGLAAVLGAVDNGLTTTMVLASPNIRGAFRDIVNRLYNEANAL